MALFLVILCDAIHYVTFLLTIISFVSLFAESAIALMVITKAMTRAVAQVTSKTSYITCSTVISDCASHALR